jgi:hypothetical protein
MFSCVEEIYDSISPPPTLIAVFNISFKSSPTNITFLASKSRAGRHGSPTAVVFFNAARLCSAAQPTHPKLIVYAIKTSIICNGVGTATRGCGTFALFSGDAGRRGPTVGPRGNRAALFMQHGLRESKAVGLCISMGLRTRALLGTRFCWCYSRRPQRCPAPSFERRSFDVRTHGHKEHHGSPKKL